MKHVGRNQTRQGRHCLRDLYQQGKGHHEGEPKSSHTPRLERSGERTWLWLAFLLQADAYEKSVGSELCFLKSPSRSLFFTSETSDVGIGAWP